MSGTRATAAYLAVQAAPIAADVLFALDHRGQNDALRCRGLLCGPSKREMLTVGEVPHEQLHFDAAVPESVLRY